MTLREFAAMALNLPVRESATWRAIYGSETAEWTLEAQLLAEIANPARWIQWAKSKDGERGRNRPQMILPPWLEDKNRERKVKKFGSDPVPLDEMDEFLGW